MGEWEVFISGGGPNLQTLVQVPLFLFYRCPDIVTDHIAGTCGSLHYNLISICCYWKKSGRDASMKLFLWNRQRTHTHTYTHANTHAHTNTHTHTNTHSYFYLYFCIIRKTKQPLIGTKRANLHNYCYRLTD